MLTERALEEGDPLRLDRAIAELSRAVRHWRRRLRHGEGLDGDPFIVEPLVATRSAFVVVSEFPESDPLKHPLLRAIYRLAEQRINLRVLVAIAAERHHVPHVVSDPERVRSSLHDLLGRALGEPKRREAWLESYVASAASLSEAVVLLWERRAEVAVRMGASSLDAIEGAGPDVAPAASQWLDRTNDMFADLAPATLGGLVDLALASDANEGFPRHLSPSTILDLFRDGDLFRSLSLDVGELPTPYGAASFLRALGDVGAAWTDATAPRDQPYVIAHDPYGLRRRTTGALFASLFGNDRFAKRSLGIDSSRLAKHRRAIAAAELIESRKAALRVVLKPAALAGRRTFREAFEAEVHRAFGLRVPPDRAGALFGLHVDDAQRFAAIVLASRQNEVMRETHDDDWYRNPRAIEQLRDESRRSPVPVTSADALAAGSDALYASLSDALG